MAITQVTTLEMSAKVSGGSTRHIAVERVKSGETPSTDKTASVR